MRTTIPRDPAHGADKQLKLERGLYVVTYHGAEDKNAPPKIVVSAMPGSEGDVEFILHPDETTPVLWQPGTTLIVRTALPASINVRVHPSIYGGSQAATVQIEPLSQGVDPASSSTMPRSSSRELDLTSFRLLGHVAGRGDVVVGPNEWVAGPGSPSRIEGVMLTWPGQPRDLNLRYAVKTMEARSSQVDLVTTGTFSGTRGKALPITSLLLEMTGSSAGNVHFLAEAIFLNSPTLRATGQRILLSGPTGREPMVGLRITIEGLGATDPIVTSRSQLTIPPMTTGRVRVFRSRPRETTDSTE